MASKLKCNNCNIVVNELLSFVQNKIDVMNNVSLALICRQSFSEEDIVEAKYLLFESVPQKKVKRKGDEKSKRNIEDIIGLLRGTDPDEIPIFVARELHKLPPVSFDHVDVTRILKDLLLVQNELKLMKESVNNDNYITREEFQQEINKIKCRKECENDSVLHFVTEPYVNTNRGGYRVQDSLNCSSGPMELITDSEKDISSPNMTVQNRFSTVSPSYASVSASVTDTSVSVAPITKPANKQSRAATAGELTVKNMPNVKTIASEPKASTPTSRNINADSRATVLSQNNLEEDWIRVVKRKSSRFRGMRGTAVVDPTGKLKAADVPIPLFIYNVSKDTTERDVAEYIFEKTRVSIIPKMIRNIKGDKSYVSFKFYVPRSKLSLITNHEL